VRDRRADDLAVDTQVPNDEGFEEQSEDPSSRLLK